MLVWAISTAVSRRFIRFFGLQQTRSIAVCVSNLWTRRSSLTGRGEGYTISLHELRAAQAIDKVFGSAPLRLPDVVRGLVDALWLRSQVACETLVTPTDPQDADLSRNLIVIGSSARNSVRAAYVRSQLPIAQLQGERAATGGRIPMGAVQTVLMSCDGDVSERVFQGLNIAIVEKCRDPALGTTVFFCFGARGDGSWAATEYLAREWKNLAREFRDKDFFVCLGFPLTERYLTTYREPIRLLSVTTTGMRLPRHEDVSTYS